MRIYFLLILSFMISCVSQKDFKVTAKDYSIQQQSEFTQIQWEFKLKSSLTPQSIGLTMSHPNTDGPSWELPKEQITPLRQGSFHIKGTYKLAPFSPKGTYYLIIHDLRDKSGKKVLIDDHIEINYK